MIITTVAQKQMVRPGLYVHLPEEICICISYPPGKYSNYKLVSILDGFVIFLQQLDQCVFRTAKCVGQKESTVTLEMLLGAKGSII